MTMHPESIPNWDSDVRQAAEELDRLFPRRDWTSTYPGHGENSAKGAYAVDCMVSPLGAETGQRIADYAWKHRKRLGVRYVIWDGKIISETSNTPNRWVTYHPTAYAISKSPASAYHRNHPHISFYTWAKYVPLTPPVTYYAAEKVNGYDVNGKVKYTRNPGFKVTGQIQTGNAKEKYLVTKYGTWYPLARLSKTKPAVKVNYLGPYWVDPKKVTTGLSIVDQKTGKVEGEFKPGHMIEKGVATKTINGRNWLLDENGNRYALDYLTTVKPESEGKA